MKRSYLPHQAQDQWLKKPIASLKLSAWLTERGSLTQKLQQHFPNLQVLPVGTQFKKSFPDEARLLHRPMYEHAMIREVLLYQKVTSLVFAHSVLPRASLRGAWQGLNRLGNKPLGAVLFANPRVRRTQLRYKKLHSHDALYRQAQAQLKKHGFAAQIRHLPAVLWARRSIFSLNCANILVTEVFLPSLFNDLNSTLPHRTLSLL